MLLVRKKRRSAGVDAPPFYITTDERFPFVPGASVSFPDTLPRQHGS